MMSFIDYFLEPHVNSRAVSTTRLGDEGVNGNEGEEGQHQRVQVSFGGFGDEAYMKQQTPISHLLVFRIKPSHRHILS